jgi:hypothetical protein
MKLMVGDMIYCIDDSIENLTKDKPYLIINTRNVMTHLERGGTFNTNDICIKGDDGINWWFGQIGETECWTNWFLSEKEWLRDKKLKELL